MVSYRTKWYHTGPCSTLQDPTRQYWTIQPIQDHTGPNRTLQDPIVPYGTILDYNEPYGTLWDHTGPYGPAFQAYGHRAVSNFLGVTHSQVQILEGHAPLKKHFQISIAKLSPSPSPSQPIPSWGLR